MASIPTTSVERVAVQVADTEAVVMLIQLARPVGHVAAVGARSVGTPLGGAIADGACGSATVMVDTTMSLSVWVMRSH